MTLSLSSGLDFDFIFLKDLIDVGLSWSDLVGASREDQTSYVAGYQSQLISETDSVRFQEYKTMTSYCK